jgi:hypothetical protein
VASSVSNKPLSWRKRHHGEGTAIVTGPVHETSNDERDGKNAMATKNSPDKSAEKRGRNTTDLLIWGRRMSTCIWANNPPLAHPATPN